jgi:hypothetical protein
VAIAFARNGRGFAVIAFGDSVRGDAVRFAGTLAGVAQSTPTRSDSTTTDASVAALIGSLFFFALLAIAIVALVRFARRKKSRARGARPMAAGPGYGLPLNPWTQDTRSGPVPRPVHAAFPPPPPSSSPSPSPPPPPPAPSSAW